MIVWDSEVAEGKVLTSALRKTSILRCGIKGEGSDESPTLTQLALAFFLIRIHKTTHAKIQRRASASLSSASVRLRGRFVWMLTRCS